KTTEVRDSQFTRRWRRKERETARRFWKIDGKTADHTDKFKKRIPFGYPFCPRNPWLDFSRASANPDPKSRACARAGSCERPRLFARQRYFGERLPFWSNALSAGNGARRGRRCKRRASYKFFRNCSRPRRSVCPDSPHNGGSSRSNN